MGHLGIVGPHGFGHGEHGLGQGEGQHGLGGHAGGQQAKNIYIFKLNMLIFIIIKILATSCIEY